MPDYVQLAKELSKAGVTLQLLWEEYVDACRLSQKQFYQLTQFKKYFNDHLKNNDFTDVIHRKAGERIEVDWSGVRPSWIDPDTGDRIYGQLFIGVLPFSQYIYAEATTDMTLPNWIKAHNNMFHYFGGVGKILVSDNLKSGVIKHTKDEIILNQTYRELAEHYDTIVVPARVRSPKDKSSVESSVNHAQRNIIARMRNYQFFTLEEYNQQLLIELQKVNDKPFQKQEGSRSQKFKELEKPCLLPLPSTRYEMSKWKEAKVQRNSHISYEKCYYSVPYTFIGKQVKIKVMEPKIELYYDGELVCTHTIIARQLGSYITDPTHMPPHSNAYSEWNKDRYLNWAKQKGPHAYQVILKRFESTKIEQQQYHTVHNILKLADKFSNDRLELACQLALEYTSIPSYKNIKGLLENNQDILFEIKEQSKKDNPESTFLRGAKYYE